MSVAPAEVRPIRPPRPVIATVLGLVLALSLVVTAKAVSTINDHPGWSTTWSQTLDRRHMPSFLRGHHHRHPTAPATASSPAAPAR
jgi:hypothetical protein